MIMDNPKQNNPKKINGLVGLTLLFAPLLVPIVGCNLAPKFEKPSVNAPAKWHSATVGNQTSLIHLNWWEQFDDKTLTQLIHSALEDNKDCQIAASRIEQARAQLGITELAQSPQVNTALGAQSYQLSQRTNPPLPPGTSRGDSYIAKLGISFELDLWGKLRNASKADRSRLLASQYNQQALRLSLIGQVASSYFQLRSLDHQLSIAVANLKAQEEILHLTKRRFQGGIASEYDFSQAHAQTEQTQASISELHRRIALQQNALCLLLGRNPSDIPRGNDIEGLQKELDIPAGLPSSLLERRPDILAAEAQLKAAHAQIGVARAAFFPSISLTGFLGAESDPLSHLLRSGSGIWNASFGLAQPVFTAGRLSSKLRVARARQKEYVLQYQKTVQTAFREVEDGLVNVRLLQAQIENKRLRVKSLQTAHKIALLRYQKGLTGFMDVLDAERNVLQAELDLDNTQSQLLIAYVSLYTAFGGGWS